MNPIQISLHDWFSGRVAINLRGIDFKKEGENRYSCNLGGANLRFYLHTKHYEDGEESNLILEAINGMPVALRPCTKTALEIMTAMPYEAFA